MIETCIFLDHYVIYRFKTIFPEVPETNAVKVDPVLEVKNKI